MDSTTVGRVICVKYKGKMYDHYGIMDGKGGVIHVNKKKGEITIDPLEKVLRNANRVTYLYDDFDTRWRTYRRAKELVGSKHTFHFLTQNCEMFVSKMRTGEAKCKQLDHIAYSITSLYLLYKGITGLLGN